MPFPQIYTLKYRGTGNPSVYYVPPGLTPVQIGDDLPGGLSFTFYNIAVPNRYDGLVMNFKGNLFCLYQGRVFRYRPGSDDDWEVVYFDSIQTTDGTSRYSKLLTYTDLAGIVRIAFIYNDSGGQTRIASSATGLIGEWDLTNLGSVGDSSKAGTVVYQNKFYHVDAGNDIVSIDPIAGVRTSISYTGNNFFEHWYRMFVHQDELFLLSINLSNGELQLEKFDGANFAAFGDITTATSGRYGSASQVANGTPAVWSDGTYIYVITNGCNGTGTGDNGSSYFRVEVNDSGIVSAIENTNVVIPASLRNRGSVSNDDRQDRWQVYVDNNTDPANPIVYLLVLEDADFDAGTWAIYRFVDHTTVMASEGAWTAGVYGPPILSYGGNEQLFIATDAAYAVHEGQEGVEGGFQLSYRVYGALGTDPVTIRLYYDDSQGAQPMTQATLIGTVTGGGTRNGNQVEDVIPDDGATLHTLIWDIDTDGVNPSTPVRIMFDAF